ncbi:MAG TPA: tetratricopeptide repeat protein [Gemmataceae bacterium]|jgi:lipoprotein NlpI|nr:tetratricopeptide repeat protein [Gemmataceae bacterium]
MRPLVLALTFASVACAGDATEFIKQARTALKKGDAAAALEAANKAVATDPKSPDAIFTRGEAYAAQRKHTEAIKDFDAALALDATYFLALDRRGSERFKLGLIDESIADFNTYLKAFPKEEPAHWRRGISFYYAGKFKEGAKQFFDGQAAFGADVENVFWHFLCNARQDGLEKAKKGLIALTGPDGRVPMMQVNELLHGKLKPDDVIKAATDAKLDADAKNEALFYANLYVGLYYEAAGDEAKTREHLTAAVEKYKIGHYMWDVAAVHLARMKKK